MNEAHQPYCDHNHTPRQRCNRARDVGVRPSERMIDVPPRAQPVAGTPGNGRDSSAPARKPVDDPRAAVVRQTVATTDVPAPTEFVTREWSRTATAVEQAYRGDTNHSLRPNIRPAQLPAIAFIAAAIGLFLLLWSRTRR